MNLGNVRLCMYIMCLFIFEEKVEILDQNTLSLNPDQKVDDPILGSRQKYWAINSTHGKYAINIIFSSYKGQILASVTCDSGRYWYITAGEKKAY